MDWLTILIGAGFVVLVGVTGLIGLVLSGAFGDAHLRNNKFD